MSGATLDRAREAKPKLAALLESVPEVRGVGIAILDDGYGLKVNVSAPVQSVEIPCEVDGVPVIVAVIGTIHSL